MYVTSDEMTWIFEVVYEFAYVTPIHFNAYKTIIMKLPFELKLDFVMFTFGFYNQCMWGMNRIE